MTDTRKKPLPKQVNSVAIKRTRDRLIARLKAAHMVGTYQDTTPKDLGQWETLRIRGGGRDITVTVRVLNGEVLLKTSNPAWRTIPLCRTTSSREQVDFLVALATGMTNRSWHEYKASTAKVIRDAQVAKEAETARVNEAIRQGNRLLLAAKVAAGYSALSPEVQVRSNGEGLAPNLTLVGPWTPDQVQEILMAVRKIRDRG